MSSRLHPAFVLFSLLPLLSSVFLLPSSSLCFPPSLLSVVSFLFFLIMSVAIQYILVFDILFRDSLFANNP